MAHSAGGSTSVGPAAKRREKVAAIPLDRISDVCADLGLRLPSVGPAEFARAHMAGDISLDAASRVE
jgi:hypothetical protein